MKSSLLADPMMRGRFCQYHATATEISILVEQQSGERRAQIPVYGLLSGEEEWSLLQKCMQILKASSNFNMELYKAYGRAVSPHIFSTNYITKLLFVFR